MPKSRHSHPMVQQIDAGFDTLDSIFDSFAAAHSYELYKSVDGDFNPPHRALSRIPQRDGLSYGIDFRVLRDEHTNAMPPFGSDMPCTMKVVAGVRIEDRCWKCLRGEIFSGLPFSRLRADLFSYLEQAHAKLEGWTYERIIADGLEEKT